MKNQYISMVGAFFLVVAALVLGGCQSEAGSFSRQEANSFVAQIEERERLKKQEEVGKSIPQPEREGECSPETSRTLRNFLEENSCKDIISPFFDGNGPWRKFSDFGIEDFLYYDSRVLYHRARQGSYIFYKDGALIMKDQIIPVLQHKLPWKLKLRILTPINVSEEKRAGGAPEWGLTISKNF